jgi:hypothetical protein
MIRFSNIRATPATNSAPPAARTQYIGRMRTTVSTKSG